MDKDYRSIEREHFLDPESRLNIERLRQARLRGFKRPYRGGIFTLTASEKTSYKDVARFTMPSFYYKGNISCHYGFLPDSNSLDSLVARLVVGDSIVSSLLAEPNRGFACQSAILYYRPNENITLEITGREDFMVSGVIIEVKTLDGGGK